MYSPKKDQVKLSILPHLFSKTIVINICILLLAISSCRKSPGPELQCNWPKGTKVEKTITNQAGKVRYVAFAGNRGDFVIDIQGDSYIGSIGPCNLPIHAQIDSLVVSVSGHQMSAPEHADMLATPFELTNIQIIKQ